ncbi:MAG: transporter substrate-binding domain-containing protein [Candidatus Marithrix sp.]|nr:transporter substrate-binding domain-containing protein [Candidatus Marithrix sp.]
MKRLKNLIILFFVIILLTSGTAVFCDDLFIFGNHDKPPKYYLENKTPKGILIDIMRYVKAETGYSFNIKLYPWKRAYYNALKGKGGIIGLSKNSERLKIFDYSDVMYYDELVLVVLKGNEFPFDKIEDIKGKTLGVQRGSSYGDEFENGKGVLFETMENDNQINRQLFYRSGMQEYTGCKDILL